MKELMLSEGYAFVERYSEVEIFFDKSVNEFIAITSDDFKQTSNDLDELKILIDDHDFS